LIEGLEMGESFYSNFKKIQRRLKERTNLWISFSPSAYG